MDSLAARHPDLAKALNGEDWKLTSVIQAVSHFEGPTRMANVDFTGVEAGLSERSREMFLSALHAALTYVLTTLPVMDQAAVYIRKGDVLGWVADTLTEALNAREVNTIHAAWKRTSEDELRDFLYQFRPLPGPHIDTTTKLACEIVRIQEGMLSKHQAVNLLERLRRIRRWSYDDLAREAQTDRNLVMDHCKGRVRPHNSTLKRYAKAFNVQVSELSK